MSSQLDILALEPFYGGPRRAMLETVMRISRHRWTLLKLPPRRIERRLTVASTWFAEQLQRHWSGQVDVLFTSEALNLADLFRSVPMLARKPSVVYFHDNQLPHVQSNVEGPLDFININTANAAGEIWFNSLFHMKTFQARVHALIFRHPEMAGRDPLPEINSKARVMPPPIDQAALQSTGQEQIARDLRKIFVDTRDADIKLFNQGLATLQRRGEQFELLTVGPVEGLAADLPRRTMSENDELAHARAMKEASIYLSVRPGATCDFHAVRALKSGCWPILPRKGVYPEILPPDLYDACLYEDTPERLANRVQDSWHISRAEVDQSEVQKLLAKYDPKSACRAIDHRLEELVTAQHIQASMK